MAVPAGSIEAYSSWGTHSLGGDRASEDGSRLDFEQLRDEVLAREKRRAERGHPLPHVRRREIRRVERLKVLPPEQEGEEAVTFDVKDVRDHQVLLSRTLPHVDDSDALFRRIRARFDRAGVQLSTVEVRVLNLIAACVHILTPHPPGPLQGHQRLCRRPSGPARHADAAEQPAQRH